MKAYADCEKNAESRNYVFSVAVRMIGLSKGCMNVKAAPIKSKRKKAFMIKSDMPNAKRNTCVQLAASRMNAP